MPRLIAIDWNETELLAVVGGVRGGVAQIEHAVAQPLADTASPVKETESAMESGLNDWVAEVGAAKTHAMVAIGRSEVELTELTLPPCPNEELPDLVRFQMQRELASLDEDAPIDFVVLSGGEAEPYRVLGAHVPQTILDKIEHTCASAGVRLKRVVFRPCATASLARRFAKANDAVQLVVHPTRNDVVMAVLDGEAIHMVRSVRLPANPAPEANDSALIQEARRTIASARQQLGDRRIDAVTICGSQARHKALAERLTSEIGVPTSVLDPIESLPANSAAIDLSPAESGRLAPLLGIILDEADGTPPVLDFLNPHHRPVEQSSTLTYALAAAVLALCVVWYGVWQFRRIAVAEQGIQDAKHQLEQLQPALKSGKETQAQAVRVAKWVQTDAVWLDEIDRLTRSLRPETLQSKEFPTGQDIVADHLHLELYTRSNTAAIQLDAVARNRDSVAPFEQRLRDAGHVVEIVKGNAESKRPNYKWDFESKVTVQMDVVFPDGE